MIKRKLRSKLIVAYGLVNDRFKLRFTKSLQIWDTGLLIAKKFLFFFYFSTTFFTRNLNNNLTCITR